MDVQQASDGCPADETDLGVEVPCARRGAWGLGVEIRTYVDVRRRTSTYVDVYVDVRRRAFPPLSSTLPWTSENH